MRSPGVPLAGPTTPWWLKIASKFPLPSAPRPDEDHTKRILHDPGLGTTTSPLWNPRMPVRSPPAVGDPPIWKLTMEPEATWKFPQLCLAPKPDQDYLKASTFGWSTNQPCEDPRGPKVTTALRQVGRSRLWKAGLCILIGQLLCLLHPGSCSPRRSPRGEGSGRQTGRDSCSLRTCRTCRTCSLRASLKKALTFLLSVWEALR